MTHDLFSLLDTARHPCFWLDANGTFWANQAARMQKPRAINTLPAIQRLMETFRHRQEEEADTPPRLLPLLTDSLLAQGLMVLPLAAGLLAFTLRTVEFDTDVFSRELREPLTGIMSVLPLLARKLEGPDAAYAGEIQNNCYSLLRLADNVESIGRLEKSEYRLQVVDLNELVTSLCDSLDTVGATRTVPLSWDAPGHPVAVQCDPRLLSGALLNLLRNALQFTRDGNTIHVRLRCVNTRAVLTVEDRGVGIPPAHLAHVFDPYYSMDPHGDTTLRPGLGLGLAIARESARAFGGTLTAESRFGEGSRFSMALPCHSDAGEMLHSEPADYLLNRYSPVYVQLCGFCRTPDA